MTLNWRFDAYTICRDTNGDRVSDEPVEVGRISQLGKFLHDSWEKQMNRLDTGYWLIFKDTTFNIDNKGIIQRAYCLLCYRP